MQPSSSVVRSRSQLTLTNHSIRSSGDSESIGPHPQSNPASSSAPRNFLRRVTLSLARTVLCCSSPSSSLSRGRKEHGGSLSRRRQTCSRRRKFGYRETRSATRCWLEGPSSSVNCEIELNPCFDHFEGQLFHRRLVNSASSTGFRASSSLLFNQQSDSVTGALGSIRGERGAWRAMGQSGSSDINANISESSLVHLTRSQLSLRSSARDGSSCVSGSRGGSEVCLSGGSIPSVYDCPVSFCEYTVQGPQTPHVLPCGHSLCQECTLKLVNAASLNNLSFSANPAGVLASLGHSKEAKCPFCRRPLPTQKNAISINYALLAVLDQYLNASSKCRKLTNGEQMTLTEDIANPAKNENCEQIIVNTDTMMNSRKVETLRSSTHAALKRLRVSHQQYESTADICQTESQTASLNRGEDQTSNMSMRTLNKSAILTFFCKRWEQLCIWQQRWQ
ncbi:uncharacterized protein LOC142358645 isoform X1 [Convolutriloba macropyga]|uniref:uncharacterized protein LOC142358645 isoform X1 n=1 Tax=Convolutriloba macropyga TaxID=536237 RepID=UPI003F51ED30